MIPKRLLIVTILYANCFFILLFVAHYTFNSYAWDTGLFNQVLWSTLHGNPFYYTLEPFWTKTNSFLGAHFAPILLLILPFYAIYPHAEALFVIHTMTITLGAIVIYKMSLYILNDEKLSFAFSIAYLFNPLVIGLISEYFHLEDFFLLFTLLSIYFFTKNDWRKYFFCMALSLMTIEYAAIPVAAWGFTILLTRIRKKIQADKVLLSAVTTIVIALIYFQLAQYMRYIFGYNPLPLHQEWNILGATKIEEVPFKIIEHPENAFNALTYDLTSKSFYLVLVFAPLLLLFEPKYLLPTLPWFIIALFSNYPPYYTIWTQYPAFIIPYLFISAIQGAKKLNHMLPKIILLGRFIKLSILLFLSLTLLFGFAGTFRLSNMSNWTHTEAVYRILALIPENASILTQDNIFPHVSSRLNAYTIPSPLEKGFESTDKEMLSSFSKLGIEYVLVDLKATEPASVAAGKIILEDFIFKSCNYGLYAAYDGIFLFKNGYFGKPIYIQGPLLLTFNYKALSLFSGQVIKVFNSRSSLVLYHSTNDPANVTFWYGPYISLLPGKYRTTFWLMIDRPTTNYVIKLDVSAYDLGEKELASRIIYGFDFPTANNWYNFTLEFTLDKPSTMVEFRGLQVSNTTGVYLDFIDVELIELTYTGCQ